MVSQRPLEAPGASSGQCQPSGIGDPHPDNLHRPFASMHGLGGRGRQPFVREVDQQIGREAMRQHDRFGDTERRTGQQA
jgi:hypothetical protein